MDQGRAGGSFQFFSVTGSRNQVGMMEIYTNFLASNVRANGRTCLPGYLEIQGFPGVIHGESPLHNVS